MALLMSLVRETRWPSVSLLAHRHCSSPYFPRLATYLCIISKIHLNSHLLNTTAEVSFRDRRPSSKNHSTTSNQPPKSTPTVKHSKHVRSLLLFGCSPWLRRNNSTTRQEVLGTLRPTCTWVRSMHYAPTAWDSNIHNLPVTSVDTPYSTCKKFDNVGREAVFSLFSIPTLRHLVLRTFQDGFPEGYRFNTDIQRVEQHLIGREKTSNVECLSIQDTENDQSTDLQEIMRWPKALKAFHCDFSLVDGISSEWPWDVSCLVCILQPQRVSLEEISADFRESTAGTFGTSFREFPKLKRLSMPRNFLVRLDSDGVYCLPWVDDESFLDYWMEDLHSALPPALEELIMNISDDVGYPENGERPNEDFMEMLKQVIVHKQELYPSLLRVVLWTRPNLLKFTPEEIELQETEMINMLGVSADMFEREGVELVYKVSRVAPTFKHPYACADAWSGQSGDTGKAPKA